MYFFFYRIFSFQHVMLSCDYEKYQNQPQSHHAEDGRAEREKPWKSEAELALKFSYFSISWNMRL